MSVLNHIGEKLGIKDLATKTGVHVIKFPALHPTEIPVVKGSEPPSWLGDRWVISAVFKPGRGDSSCGCHSSCDRASKCWTSGFCQGLMKM